MTNESNGPTYHWLRLQAMARREELKREIERVRTYKSELESKLRQVRAEMAELDRREDERREKQMEPLRRLFAGYPDELTDDELTDDELIDN